ncbi:MAG: hypothetical protein ABSD98_16155, partial [Candidatus Korobacteraceae bacterium]
MPYISAYPRPGKVALLCEGDVIGYEATLFQKWTGAELGNEPLVDIWPCGTCTSILGISDAIGRSRPIFAIEDRDFRSPDESRQDCEKVRKDRERRGVQILAWCTWNRCEIENYLLEPDVLLPVFRAAFNCSDDDIVRALNEILPALALFQAGQYATARARRTWASTDPGSALLFGIRSRPEWKENGIASPDYEAFRTGLEKNGRNWIEQVQATQYDVIGDFDAKFKPWKDCQWSNDFWRNDWAGKEILHWLRIVMTNRFGWPVDGESGNREALNWTMGRPEREAQDRPIEAAL